jgi:hypothetical protein
MTEPSPDRRTPIGIILDQIVVYVFTSMLAVLTTLIGWLCIQTMALKQDTATILEHGKQNDRQLEKHENILQGLTVNDRLQIEEIEALRLTMVEHGWKNFSRSNK